MRKSRINALIIPLLLVSLYILLFQGFGFPSLSTPLTALLRILATLCAQLFFLCNFKAMSLRLLPLFAATLLALWGGWLFLTSSAWENATLGGYLADYCSPLLTCAAVWLLKKK